MARLHPGSSRGRCSDRRSTRPGPFGSQALYRRPRISSTGCSHRCFPITERLPIPRHDGSRGHGRSSTRSSTGLIAERRATGAGGDDLLSRLIHAQDAGSGMTDEQVRDEAITIFLAGHETTSNALTWTWLLLSEHRDVEAQFHERPGRRSVRPRGAARVDAALPAGVGDREASPLRARRGRRPHPRGAVVIVSPWLMPSRSSLVGRALTTLPAGSDGSTGAASHTGTRSCPSAAVLGCASAKGSPSSKRASCCRRSVGGGGSSTTRHTASSSSRSSRCDHAADADARVIGAAPAPDWLRPP